MAPAQTPPHPHRTMRVCIVALVCTVAALVLLPFDDSLIARVRALSLESADLFLRLTTDLGDALTLGFLFLALLAFHAERRLAVAGVLSLALGGLLAQGGKFLTHRTRPNGHGLSFPSGHTLVAFAAAVVLADRYPRHATSFYLAASMVGLSRVFLLVHFPSDVMAGAAFGLMVGLASLAVADGLLPLQRARWLRTAAACLLVPLAIGAILASCYAVPRYRLALALGPATLCLIAHRGAILSARGAPRDAD